MAEICHLYYIMEIVRTGNKDNYKSARVRAYVYQCTGEYEKYPECIDEMIFSNQFSDYELVSMISLRAGYTWAIDDYKPDIRKITIDYLED